MKSITHKQITLRKAAGMAILLCSKETVDLIKANLLPKGNVFEFARAAGLLGAKNTQHLLPHCHPVGIESMDFTFDLLDQTSFRDLIDETIWLRHGILIRANASSIGRTGIEMEVLTGISIAALEIYDFLKPHDKAIEITSLKLLDKTGGKSDRRNLLSIKPECAVLVCSDTISQAINEGKDDVIDHSGQLLMKILKEKGADPIYYSVVSDDKEIIENKLLEWVALDVPYIFTCGGTGLDPRDQTVEAVRTIIEKEAPGVTEAMRAYGRTIVPTAILSASVAGSVKKTFIVTLPGSPSGVKESIDAILPAVFHARLMLEGKGH